MRSLARISNGMMRPGLTDWVDSVFGRELTSFWDDFPVKFKAPATNIRESDDDFVIEVAAPGMEKSDFEVNVDNGVLIIAFEREEKKETSEEEYTHKEFGYSSFRRRFSLPESVNGDRVDAQYKDGVLLVTLPKKEEAKKKPARLISVK